MAEDAQYNYAVVKKLAGQGLLYIRIKKGYEFALKNPSQSDTEDLVTVIEQVVNNLRSLKQIIQGSCLLHSIQKPIVAAQM